MSSCSEDREYVSIRVLKTQLDALREGFERAGGRGLSDDDLYSAAAIGVLLYAMPLVEPDYGPADQKSQNA